jgi:amidase
LSIIAASPVFSGPESIELKSLKIALWIDEPGLTLDPESKAVVVRLAEQLARLGAIVEPIKSPMQTRAMMFAYTTLLLAVIGFEMPWLQRSAYELLRGPAKIARACGAGPFSWAHGALGVTARHREWLGANEARAKLALSVHEFFAQFDLVLAPATPVVAFPHNHAPVLLRKLKCSDGHSIKYLEMLDWVGFATMFGLPATAVPAGLTDRGLPVGVQIIGPHGRDSLTLSLAQIIDEQIGGFRPPPCVQVV